MTGPAKPELRRRTWTRYHHELVNAPLWRRVARLSGQPLHMVEALVLRLEVHASASDPLGVVEDYDLASLAAHWSLPSDDPVGRIYAALEDVGWIEQGQIATYWARNPDGEQEEIERRRELDRRRKRRSRENARAEKKAARDALRFPQSRDGHVTGVTVRPRSDLILRSAAVENCKGEPGGEAWLGREGVEIVVRRMNDNPSRAAQRIERWLGVLKQDAAALVAILEAEDERGASGPHFHMRVSAAVNDRAQGVDKSPALPLGPVPVQKPRHG